MVDGWEWDPTLFLGSARYYPRGRLPYAPGLPELMAEVLPPGGGARLLDLVLSGLLRLALGGHDLVLTSGEAAEFDTRTPHGFGNAGPQPVEFLSLFGAQGERMHVRARPTPS